MADFDLTTDELRAVTRYVVQHAEDVLPVFEEAVPGDPRPRAAISAAWAFINGERRTRLQRVTSVAAHRAATSAPTEAARLAARSAGDAAAAAYLHPIARATQVGHILRAAASAARIAELEPDAARTASGAAARVAGLGLDGAAARVAGLGSGGAGGAAARVAGLGSGGAAGRVAGPDEGAGGIADGEVLLARSLRRATPVLIDVLRRYPPVPAGTSRVAQLMSNLDRSLRQAS